MSTNQSPSSPGDIATTTMHEANVRISRSTITEAFAIVVFSACVAFLINAWYHPSPLPWIYEARKVESASTALLDSLMAPAATTAAPAGAVATTRSAAEPVTHAGSAEQANAVKGSAEGKASEAKAGGAESHGTPRTETSAAPASTTKSSSAESVTTSSGASALKLPIAVSYDQVLKLLASPGSVTFIDARKKEEHDKGSLAGSLNVDVLQFQANPMYRDECMRVLYSLPKDKILVAYCGGGNCELSHELCDILIPMGFSKVCIYLGGWNEYKEKQKIKD